MCCCSRSALSRLMRVPIWKDTFEILFTAVAGVCSTVSVKDCPVLAADCGTVTIRNASGAVYVGSGDCSGKSTGLASRNDYSVGPAFGISSVDVSNASRPVVSVLVNVGDSGPLPAWILLFGIAVLESAN